MSSYPDPLIPAQAEFRADGALYSTRFGDVYASESGALEQARHVFLAGNGLPERWTKRPAFTILETGFGAGLNFLATWREWRQSAPQTARLHFLSAEKHPFTKEGLALIHARYPEVGRLAGELQANWPVLVPGFHRLHLDGGRVTLTLLFGDAARMLAQVDASVDAFLLDGFAPGRNAEMWSAVLFAEIARLAAPGATCATYTVAATVRLGLSAVGFSIEKRPGFASKREMLAGVFQGNGQRVAGAAGKHALVIGAGLAGTSCAERLAARGWTVDLYERHALPAQEASGNPAGLIRPVVSADWNSHSRFTTAAFLYARRQVERLAGAGHAIVRGEGGVLQLPRSAERFEKQQRLVETWALPGDFLRTVSRAEASDLAGVPVAGAGWWFPDGQWAAPSTMCEANIQSSGAVVRRHFGSLVADIEQRDGLWSLVDDRGNVLGSAPILVLANALQAMELGPAAWLPLRPVRGQVSMVPARGSGGLRIAVSGDGYVSPAVDGWHCVGASFNEGMADPLERIEDHAGNLARLERMLPGYAAGIEPASLKGRVAFRTMARDRLPIVGNLGMPGLYACLGLGSRGMTWSALSAELLASQIAGEPLPVERELVKALAPERFRSAVT